MDRSPPGALTLVRGCVVEAYAGLNTYRVHIERGGWSNAIYEGATRGVLGANESGGFLPGQFVWVGVDLTNSAQGMPGVIVSACARLNQDPHQDTFPVRYAGLGEQVGYRHGEGLTGQLRSNNLATGALYFAEEANIADALPGDWMMNSQSGAGVGVEGWRSWLTGGPFCSVTCWADPQMLRIEARTLQVRTFTREDEETHEGNCALFVGRRHLYVEEALSDSPPRELKVEGPLHGGAHTFTATKLRAIDPPSGGASPGGDGSPPPVLTPAPAALLHEHRGVDGSYLLRASHSIHLIRSVSVRLPLETVPVLPPVASSNGNVYDFPDRAAAANGEVTRQLSDPRPYLALRTYPKDLASPTQDLIPDPCAAQLRPLTALEQLLNMVWRSYQGLERTSMWTVAPAVEIPEALPGTGKLRTDTSGLTNMPLGMWYENKMYNIPYDMHLPAVGVSAGTSGISMLADGSVVIRDAWGSQITMSGGSVTISAANDVVTLPGRNAFTMAGQHVVVRAHENVEVDAAHGRVGIKAETELGLLGGNGGTGGVLIDSRAQSVGYVQGEGSAQRHDGLTILSRSAVTLISPKIRLEATTDLDTTYFGTVPSEPDSGIDGGSVEIVAARTSISSFYSTMSVGDNIAIRIADTGAWSNTLFDARSVTLPKVYSPEVCQQPAPTNEHVELAEDATAAMLTYVAKQKSEQNGLVGDNQIRMGFTWWTSAQYGAQTNDQFALFEQPWQRAYRAAGTAVPRRWTSAAVVNGTDRTDRTGGNIGPSATLPFPGFETWVRTGGYDGVGAEAVYTPGPFVTLPLTDWWDPLTDTYKPALKDKDGPVSDQTYILPLSEGVSLDSNYIIRPSPTGN